jgi:hypothetical protein
MMKEAANDNILYSKGNQYISLWIIEVIQDNFEISYSNLATFYRNFITLFIDSRNWMALSLLLVKLSKHQSFEDRGDEIWLFWATPWETLL